MFGCSLVGSGHVDKAAIVSAAGDSVWAATAGFTVRYPPHLFIHLQCISQSPAILFTDGGDVENSEQAKK